MIGFIKTIEAARLSGCKQFIFASSIGTYARDCNDAAIDDMSQQRPNLVYGVSKVFGENLGAYYRVKYGMDFRCIRYPSIVGPGVTTRSLAQYTAWMVEYPLQGKPFEIWVREGQVIPLLYYKDAARAALDILDAPIEKIKGMSYLVDMKNGFDKTPTAGEMAALVRKKIPGAQITFDENAPPVRVLRINDWRAKEEWDWKAEYDFEGMVDDMIAHYRAANN